MIKVIARKGVRVPLEDSARRYITDAESVEIDERSAYYIRRLRDGDLLLETEKPVVAAPKIAEPAAKSAAPVADKSADSNAKKEG